jgi:hypothetical protein
LLPNYDLLLKLNFACIRHLQHPLNQLKLTPLYRCTHPGKYCTHSNSLGTSRCLLSHLGSKRVRLNSGRTFASPAAYSPTSPLAPSHSPHMIQKRTPELSS